MASGSKWKRESLLGWKAADEWKSLASQLRVGGVFAAKSKSGQQGEYEPPLTNSDNPARFYVDGWKVPITRIRQIDRSYNKGLPIILIDTLIACKLEGVSNVISHELGHHIDRLANGRYKDMPPKKAFRAAFTSAGLLSEPTHDEQIAELLGAYLRGHELNIVLLAEVRKVLAKLPRSKAKLINEFRRNQIARKERAA